SESYNLCQVSVLRDSLPPLVGTIPNVGGRIVLGVLPGRDPLHGRVEGLFPFAGPGPELRHVEARHRVGFPPRGDNLVPGPGVELLPRHLPRRLRCPEIAAGRLLRGAHVCKSALLRYAPQQSRPPLFVDQPCRSLRGLLQPGGGAARFFTHGDDARGGRQSSKSATADILERRSELSSPLTLLLGRGTNKSCAVV
ncbi:hypothetical protein MUK42_36340, partial [Musa troglodytarum]